MNPSPRASAGTSDPGTRHPGTPAATTLAPDISVVATGLVAQFAAAGVLELADVQIARTLCRLGGEDRASVHLAVALTSRALRRGSGCLVLNQARDEIRETLLDPALIDPVTSPAGADELQQRQKLLDALEWPDPDAWLAELLDSPVAGESAHQPVRVWEGRVYLTRYAVAEAGVVDLLAARVDAPAPLVDEALLAATQAAIFSPGPNRPADPHQILACDTAVRSWTTVLAGGPGTGKTTTVAAMLAMIQSQYPEPVRVALAAPTGRASRRLAAAVAEQAATLSPRVTLPPLPPAVTLHRLLGSRGPGRGFSYGPQHRLSYDVIVVDEMSMVALPMLYRLMSALGPSTRLILVGDPHQLASVEAGQVMTDLAELDLPRFPGASESSVVTLVRNHRNTGLIAETAQAIRDHDADRALELLKSGDPTVQLVETDDPYVTLDQIPGLLDTVVDAGVRMVRAARDGDAATALEALDSQRLMCAHRRGPYGVSRWSSLVRDAVYAQLPGFADVGDWYPGRPVLASVNDDDLGVSNGDSGVVIAAPGAAGDPYSTGGTAVAFGDRHQQRTVAGWLLPGLTTLWAMTIHKGQGSQYPQVCVVLPPVGSPLLTRELLYTALTRAQDHVTLIASTDAVRAAMNTPTRRASGLAARWAQRVPRRIDPSRPDAEDPAPF